MDRNVFITFDKFVDFNTSLLAATGLSLYRCDSHEHPFLHANGESRYMNLEAYG